VVLIDEEDVGVEIDGGDQEKPEEVDFDRQRDGFLESFEGSEERFLVGFVLVVIVMIGLSRLSSLLFSKFHWNGFEI
jgi:hypothetical protein